METEIVISVLPYWLDFFSSLIYATSWPIAAVLIIFFLKDSLAKLVTKVTKLNKVSAKGLEIEFSIPIKDAELAIETVVKADETIINDKIVHEELNEAKEIASTYADLAIIRSWKIIQKKIYSMISNDIGINVRFPDIVKALLDERLIDISAYKKIRKLGSIRNRVANYATESVSSKAGLDFVKLCDDLLTELEK